MAVPLIIAGAAAAAGAIGGIAGSAAGVGQNRRQAGAFYDPKGERNTGYDPNAAMWNGDPEARAKYQAAMDARGWHAERRAAPQSTGVQAQYGRANDWDSQSQYAREAQGGIAGLMAARARGEVPSIASQQAALDQAAIHQNAQNQMGLLQQGGANQIRQSQAQQAAQAGSARGAAGVALAGQSAANNNANTSQAVGHNVAQQSGNIGMMAAQAGQNVGNQAQVNAANERLAAEQAAFGAYSGMRGGDVQSQGQAAEQAQFQAGLTQQNDQFNTGAQLQSRQVNDARVMGYENLYADASKAEMAAKGQQQATIAGSYNAAEGVNQATAQKNAETKAGFFKQIFSSDERTKQPLSSVWDEKPKEEEGGMMKSMMSMMGGAGGAAGGASKGGGFMSDTRAKEAALLARGRQQGIAMAGGQPANDADPAALDDRFAQHEATRRQGNSNGQYRRTLDISDREAADDRSRVALEQAMRPSQEDSAQAQWSRSFGSVDAAGDDVRKRDNAIEAQRIRDDFAPAGAEQKQPWWMQDVDAPGFRSDEETKKPVDLGDVEDWDKGDAFRPAPSVSDAIASKQREGRRDPTSFKRDTKADQKRTKDAFFLKLMKDADAQIAANRTSVGRGASVAIDEGEVDDDRRLASSGFTSDERAKEVAKREGIKIGLSNGYDLGKAGEAPPMGYKPAGSPSAVPAPAEALKRGANVDAYISEPKPRQMESFRRDTGGSHPDVAEGRERASNAAYEEGMRGQPGRPRTPVDTGPVAEANRAMIGKPYAYRDEFTPPHEKPGQPHFGFVTQNLRKSPVAKTAVDVDPETGLDVVDRDRMLQVVASGVADLQKQQDQTRAMLGKGRRGKR